MMHLGLFPVEVLLYKTTEGFVAGVQARGGDITVEDTDRCLGLTYDLLGASSEILVGVFDSSAGTLVHELYHAVTRIQNFLGITVEAGNDETGAYMIGHLTDLGIRGI